jgi:uncharacterized membrane protein YdbT with pleckstrin-like domain
VILWQVPDPPWLWYAGLAVVGVAVLWAAVHHIELMTSEFAVTTTRVIFKVGLIARYTTELLLTKVESIGVNQSLGGRMCNFGDLTVIGTVARVKCSVACAIPSASATTCSRRRRQPENSARPDSSSNPDS